MRYREKKNLQQFQYDQLLQFQRYRVFIGFLAHKAQLETIVAQLQRSYSIASYIVTIVINRLIGMYSLRDQIANIFLQSTLAKQYNSASQQYLYALVHGAIRGSAGAVYYFESLCSSLLLSKHYIDFSSWVKQIRQCHIIRK